MKLLRITILNLFFQFSKSYSTWSWSDEPTRWPLSCQLPSRIRCPIPARSKFKQSSFLHEFFRWNIHKPFPNYTPMITFCLYVFVQTCSRKVRRFHNKALSFPNAYALSRKWETWNPATRWRRPINRISTRNKFYIMMLHLDTGFHTRLISH